MKAEIFGYLAAILTTAAFLPQLIKTLKTKKADDVSLTTLVMFIMGVLSWIIYGYNISSKPILIAKTTLFRLEPKDAIITKAKARVGILCMMSTKR